MDFYADVLDHIGKTPREFHGVHVHFEGVTRAPGPSRAVASLLFQAAFEPPPTVSLRFSAGSAAAPTLAVFESPATRDGAVIRACYPLVLPDGVNELFVRFSGDGPAPGSERIRPAWMLHDTLEIPKLSEMDPIQMGAPGLDARGSILDSLLTGELSVDLEFGSTIGQAKASRIHKARELPPGLAAAVVEATGQWVDSPQFERLWAPGDPLPSAASSPTFHPLDEPRQRGPSVRRCVLCGFEGPADEYERAVFCPNCDAVWR